MQKLEQKVLSLVASFATAALLATAGGLVAQNADEQQQEEQKEQKQQEQKQTGTAQDRSQASEPGSAENRSTAPARRAVPQVTGTVIRWTGNRIDLKKSDGKMQKVAVNADTERLMEIKEGAEVIVEYRRKIGDFVIAQRVRPVEEGATAAQSGAAKAPGQKPNSVTGSVVSWNNAALVLRTEAGDVTLYLSPTTEYLVKSLDPGLPVIVEYREGADRAKMATRVRAQEKGSARKKDDPE